MLNCQYIYAYYCNVEQVKKKMKQLEVETLVRHSTKEVWRVFVKNFQVTAPAAVPQHYSSVKYLDGPPLAPGGIMQVNNNPDGNTSPDHIITGHIDPFNSSLSHGLCFSLGFAHYEYVKYVWDDVDHDKLVFKLRAIEGGYLGKHTDPTLIHTAHFVNGPEPNTTIIKWVSEYDENFDNTFESFLIQEIHIFAEYMESHITDVCP